MKRKVQHPQNVLWSPGCNTKMVPVIELSGVQFGLKSYVPFQNRTSKKIMKVTYQALALCQDDMLDTSALQVLWG